MKPAKLLFACIFCAMFTVSLGVDIIDLNEQSIAKIDKTKLKRPGAGEIGA